MSLGIAFYKFSSGFLLRNTQVWHGQTSVCNDLGNFKIAKVSLSFAVTVHNI